MADVTYYFDSYGVSEWTDPDNIVDGDIETFASESITTDRMELDTNTCPGTNLGTISAVELRAYAYGDGGDKITIYSEFDGVLSSSTHDIVPGTEAAWSSYVNITTDNSAPSPWTWDDIQTLDIRHYYYATGKANILYCAKVEIRVTYTPGVGWTGEYCGVSVTEFDGVTPDEIDGV